MHGLHFRIQSVVSWTQLPLDKMVAILADDKLKCISLTDHDRIQIWISLEVIPRSPIDNESALV